MAMVRIGSLEFFGGAGSDGFYIEGEGLQGLLSGVDVKRENISRPQAHGDFDVPGFLEARVVSLSGLCLAGSAEVLSYRGRQLTGLLAEGGSSPVVFDVPGGALWGRARLASKPEFDVTLWGSMARYQLSLLFANPRLFGESRSVASGAASVNYGNFAATPVFTVSGSMPSGYTISGPVGKSFQVSKPLLPGVPHVIDLATGYLSVAGVVQTGVTPVANVWGVPAGGALVHALTGSGTGALVTTVVDTYV